MVLSDAQLVAGAAIHWMGEAKKAQAELVRLRKALEDIAYREQTRTVYDHEFIQDLQRVACVAIRWKRPNA